MTFKMTLGEANSLIKACLCIIQDCLSRAADNNRREDWREMDKRIAKDYSDLRQMLQRQIDEQTIN